MEQRGEEEQGTEKEKKNGEGWKYEDKTRKDRRRKVNLILSFHDLRMPT
jgi:hypothetical protein